MTYLWDQLRAALPLIVHGNSYILEVTWTTLRVALISTTCALAIGIVLLFLILVLIGLLTLLQHRAGGLHLRFRPG